MGSFIHRLTERLLIRMFETRPDVVSVFDRFRAIDQADLGASSLLEIHAMIVMDALDDVVANLDDRDYVIDTLLATGRSHRRFRVENFSAAIFWVSISLLMAEPTHSVLSIGDICLICLPYSKIDVGYSGSLNPTAFRLFQQDLAFCAYTTGEPNTVLN